MSKKPAIQFIQKSKILNELKANPGLTQKEIAKRFKVSEASVARIKAQGESIKEKESCCTTDKSRKKRKKRKSCRIIGPAL